ncbi:MAG: sugar transferase [Candidatus Anammoximicrobium sp.]|nr:sugar transferase [Candidatus Anammoximicrobium sp.]
MTKRCFDITVAWLGLLFLSPLLFVVFLAIYATEGRPVFFRQRRIGWKGRPFTMYKFRTMRIARNTESGSFDAGDGSRVTRLGQVLRKTKLDELPQLWNVLRGDMSLVGPRPEVEQWVGLYPHRWAKVLQVRPGVTDPASIVYRDEERLLGQAADPLQTYRQHVLPHKLTLYEEYVATRTFWRDLRIIAQTLLAVVWPRAGKEPL